MLAYLDEFLEQGFTLYLALVTDLSGNAASPTLAAGDITVRFGVGGTDLTNVASSPGPTTFVAEYVSGMEGVVALTFSDAQVSDLLMLVKVEDQDGPAFLTQAFPVYLQPNTTKFDGTYQKGYKSDGTTVVNHQPLSKSGSETIRGPKTPGDVAP